MSDPLLFVIMASYSHERYVRQAIESVLAQRGGELELLVEDDGSSDRTARVIRSLRDRRLHFVKKGHNEGAYATHNNLRRARGLLV